MRSKTRRFAALLVLAALGAGLPLTDAQADGGRGGYGHGHGHGHGGPGWGGVVLGTGLGFGLGWLSGQRSASTTVYSTAPAYGWVEPAPVVVYRQPPPVVVYREPPVVYSPPPVVYSPPLPPPAPEPVIYPRNGQSPEQTEADRQACNRWATTQRNAMADSSVFNRATDACMDARGYTLR